jgi:CRP-like cAMP-binding protein
MIADEYADIFKIEALAGQLAFLLLVLGVLSHRYSRARAMIAAGAFIGLVQSLIISRNDLAAFWWGLLLLASLTVLTRRLFQNSRTRFTVEEEAMLAGLFSALPRSRARHLLDQGFWLSGREGDVLTRENEPVGHLYFLATGEARVISHGRQVGVCRAGDLVGEVTVLSGHLASATVVLSGPARFWCSPAHVLRPYLKTHSDVRHALEQGFATSLQSKLRSSNERMAEAGGIAA